MNYQTEDACFAQAESVEAELLRRNQELTELNEKLSRAQEQLLQFSCYFDSISASWASPPHHQGRQQ